MDGEVEGSINSSKEVTIGKNGHVNGSVVVSKLIVQGFIEGSIDAQSVHIKSAGRVSGEITSSELVIESKAIFEGTSIVKDTKASSTMTQKEISKS